MDIIGLPDVVDVRAARRDRRTNREVKYRVNPDCLRQTPRHALSPYRGGRSSQNRAAIAESVGY